jgi:hypothetical protein
VAAAFVAAISLLLSELRAHRANTPLTDDEIREALLYLEATLRHWQRLAERTNEAARRLDAAERDADARADLIVFGSSNVAYGVEIGLPAFHDGRLASLIRIYAPNLLSVSDQMSERLETVQSALTWAAMGDDELDVDARRDLLSQLARTQQGLDGAASEVAEFIRDAFPLGAS